MFFPHPRRYHFLSLFRKKHIKTNPIDHIKFDDPQRGYLATIYQNHIKLNKTFMYNT